MLKILVFMKMCSHCHFSCLLSDIKGNVCAIIHVAHLWIEATPVMVFMICT